MGAPDILQHLAAAGVKLTRNGGNLIATPRAAVTPNVLHLIRQHKPELLDALSDRSSNVPTAAPTIALDERCAVTAGVMTPAAEARRHRVLAMLAERPGIRYAVITDAGTHSDAVILALAIRGVGTCDFRIPREKYDGVLLRVLMERHCGTVH